MPKIIKIHYGRIVKDFKLDTCYECNEFVDELWECNTCGHKFCQDHIIQEGNETDDISFICIECDKKRRYL